jgi:two-component system, OmpR family, sensor histidine kinase TctE
MKKPHQAIALERLLLKSTLLPAMWFIVLSACVDYRLSSNIAQETQDAMLLRTAYALAARLTPDEADESPQDLAKHLDDQPHLIPVSTHDAEINYAIIEDDGNLLAGSSELMTLARRHMSSEDVPQFDNKEFHGNPVRIVEFSKLIGKFNHHILVSETREKKANATNQLFWNTLWPNLLLLLVISLVLLRGIRKATEPLHIVCDHIDNRPTGDLSPIPIGHTALEVQTLITAMNRLLQRLSLANQEQQIFLSGAAHQLRTPLAGIQTQLELAIDESSTHSHERLTRILQAIQGLSHCSQQMLTLARSSSPANERQEFTNINLCEVARELGSIWLDTALKKNIELDFDLKPAPVHGSRWMLQELLGNLIDNAIKYSPDGCDIQIHCYTTQDQQACLEVIDQGPGIPELQLVHVFSPFYRGAHPTISGSGLGLTIANEIVKRHHGALTFLPLPPGHGTHVRVTFPAVRP